MNKGVVYANFDLNAIKEQCKATVEELDEKIINALCYAGEQAVNKARDLKVEEGSYHDITGNLRSSIGYVVVKNGKEVKFEKPKAKKGKKGDGRKGARNGTKFLKKIMGKYKKGYALIVTAGMNYAEYVENYRKKDVLASAELTAERISNNLIGALFKK